MNIYIVCKEVNLINGDKTYKKNRTFKESSVSAENLKRWKEKGFVKLVDIGTDAEEEEEEEVIAGIPENNNSNSENSNDGDDGEDDKIPPDGTSDGKAGETGQYLTEEEINKMNKTTLKKYAKEIGIPEIDNSLSVEDIRILVNGYIKALEVEKEGPENE